VTDRIQMPHQSIKPVGRPAQQIRPGTKPSFKDVFTKELDKTGLKFSAHAQKRLAARNINLTEKEFEKVQAGVNKAADKGARESLILVDNLAFVVSVKNRTVITAIDGENMKENVFTNIDSAVIM